MNTISIKNKGSVRIIAHRGCSGLEKENTMPAFVAAGNRSYFGIETDIHKTKDGKYIVIHDDTTARVAIDNMVVEETDYDTLRALPLTDKDGVAGRIDLRMPNLTEYINVCRYYEKYAVLEIKNAFLEEDILEIVDIIEKLGYLDKTIFISFCFENLKSLRKSHPTIAAQFLTKAFSEDLIPRLKEYNLDLDIRHSALDKEKIALCHENGILVNCWTVDDADKAEQLILNGVDFITTNILE